MYTKTIASLKPDDMNTAGSRAIDLGQVSMDVPESFVILSTALQAVINENTLKPKFDFLMGHLKPEDGRSLMNLYTSVRKQLTVAKIPKNLLEELKEHYDSISAAGIGLSGKVQPLRVILSTNAPEDPENNDTIIQNIQSWDEFLLAIREVWALAWLPSQFSYRRQHKFEETILRSAILVQVMHPADVSVHTHSAMPEDTSKVYAEVYTGFTDLREKVTKDYYAITKDQLEIVLKELHEQKTQLSMQGTELILQDVNSPRTDDKLIRRRIEELARLTKKVERTLGSPVKCFFVVAGEKIILQWVNRLPFDASVTPAGETPSEEPIVEESETPVQTDNVEVVDMPDVAITPDMEGMTLNQALDTSPEKEFATAQHAAEEAIEEAAAVELPEEESDLRGAEKLLASSLKLAMRVIEKKYSELYGQVGDDFHEMVDTLNTENVFSRSIDGELLRIANNVVEHGLSVSNRDYNKVIDEITFILEA